MAKKPQKTVVANLTCGEEHLFKLFTGEHEEAYTEASAWVIEWMKDNPNRAFRIIYSEVTNCLEF